MNLFQGKGEHGATAPNFNASLGRPDTTTVLIGHTDLGMENGAARALALKMSDGSRDKKVSG